MSEKKFLAADQTAAVSARGLAIGEDRPTDEIERKSKSCADKLVADARLAEAKDYRMLWKRS